MVLEALEPRLMLAAAVDTSPPAFLQWFESSHETMTDRMADLFMAGYGAVWAPPPSRGDTSDLTVGYDVYDRFDLGQWDQKTLYGTETSLKQTADMLHRAGLDLHVDFVLNHNGYATLATPGFYDACGSTSFRNCPVSAATGTRGRPSVMYDMTVPWKSDPPVTARSNRRATSR